MEGRKRRSRTRRQKTGKSLVLTERDLAIFQLLERYRYLRSTVLHAFAGGASVTRFKERLGDLYHEGGYLNRPAQQWETAHSRYLPAVYENSDRARDTLAAQGRLADPCPHMPYGTSNAGRQFAHSLMICETLASIELQVIGRPDVRFVAWPEILAKAPEATRHSIFPLRFPVPGSSSALRNSGIPYRAYVVPDAVFGLEYLVGASKYYRFFALEADRGTMPIVRARAGQSAYLAKLSIYEELLATGALRSHLGIPNLLVLTVTASEDRKRHIMSAFSKRTGDHAPFLFSVAKRKQPREDCRPLESLSCESWQRIDHAPLDILDAGV